MFAVLPLRAVTHCWSVAVVVQWPQRGVRHLILWIQL